PLAGFYGPKGLGFDSGVIEKRLTVLGRRGEDRKLALRMDFDRQTVEEHFELIELSLVTGRNPEFHLLSSLRSCASPSVIIRIRVLAAERPRTCAYRCSGKNSPMIRLWASNNSRQPFFASVIILASSSSEKAAPSAVP